MSHTEPRSRGSTVRLLLVMTALLSPACQVDEAAPAADASPPVDLGGSTPVDATSNPDAAAVDDLGVPDPVVDATPGDAGRDDAGPPVGDAAPPAPPTLTFVAPTEPTTLRLSAGARSDGRDRVDLVVRLAAGGAPLPDVAVRFAATAAGAGHPVVRPPEARTDAAGEVRVALHAGGFPGATEVIARASVEGVDVIARSPRIAIEGGAPSGRGLAFDCAAPILPAFDARPSADDWRVPPDAQGTICTLVLADRHGQRLVDPPTVRFLTEAGTLAPVASPAPGTAAVHLSPLGPPPVVHGDPFDPTDGVTTLLAHVRGEERFRDVDGDGVYTAAIDLLEPEDDLAEPFLDQNDNGAFDDGEPFVDADGDGVWSPPNSVWDADTTLWAATRVLFVGRPDPDRSTLRSTCLPDGDRCRAPGPTCAEDATLFLDPDAAAVLEVVVADANGNCVGGPDQVALEATSDSPHLQVEALPPDPDAPCGASGEPGARPIRLHVRAAAPREVVPGATLTLEARYVDAVGTPRTFTQRIRACVLSD